MVLDGQLRGFSWFGSLISDTWIHSQNETNTFGMNKKGHSKCIDATAHENIKVRIVQRLSSLGARSPSKQAERLFKVSGQGRAACIFQPVKKIRAERRWLEYFMARETIRCCCRRQRRYASSDEWIFAPPAPPPLRALCCPRAGATNVDSLHSTSHAYISSRDEMFWWIRIGIISQFEENICDTAHKIQEV